MSATPVIVVNTGLQKASSAPVSAGVPFAKGALRDPHTLRLVAAGAKAVPLQAQTMARWPDGSCRWVLADFRASAAAGREVKFALRRSVPNPSVRNAATVARSSTGVTLANGRVAVSVTLGESSAVLSAAGEAASAEIASVVTIGDVGGPIASKVKITSFEVYASGPLRAAVSLRGERLYDDGQVGPFAQRIELFADSPHIRVEDTFVYAHFPGSHARPEHPLVYWGLSATPSSRRAKVDMIPLVAPEEAEGLVSKKHSVAFWGRKKPLDLSRWTDEDLVGEDAPGIALGLGKSCAVLVGLNPSKKESDAAAGWGRVSAHTTPGVYARSGALGDFAPERTGRFKDVEEGMRQILGFWLWFQDNDPKGLWVRGPWHGMLDWGDWQTRYADRKHEPTGWNYLQGRYGWDCNEMDTTLGLWFAFAHTGRREYWHAAVAMSRHIMDVDTIHVDYRKYKLPKYVYDKHHYGAPWREGRDRMFDMNTVGLCRRHNVQHWGNGVGDTRHSWNGGLMMYYYMTGNRRAHDVAIAIADMHMQRMWGAASGEYTLSIWAIYHAWQITGDRRYLDELDYRVGLVERFLRPDGTLPEHLDFTKGADYPDVDKGCGSYLDLTIDYASNGLIDYYADTGDARVRRILLGLAERVLRDTPPKGASDYMYIDTARLMAWAYNETGKRPFLERALFHLGSTAARPPSGKPRDDRELLAATFDLLKPFEWDIRVVGPLVRMAPYVMAAAERAKCSRR